MKTSSLAVLGLVAMTCACAPGPRRGPPGGGFGPDRPPVSGPQIFVSPFGEPFEAGPDASYPVAAWFAGADADGDGRLTPAEFEADGLRWFGRLDTDGDGRVGPAEIAAYEAMMGRRLGGRGQPGSEGGGRRPDARPGGPGEGFGAGPLGLAADQDGPRGGPGGGPGGGPRGGAAGGARTASTPLARANLLAVPQPVKSADQDMNQYVTREEQVRAAQRWFSLLDRDRNGVLTLAELPRTGVQDGAGRGPDRGSRGRP